MPLNDGQFFAGFKIIRLLGSGGMGEVYLAQHPRLPRRDALKVLPAEYAADPEFRSRFERESDLASTLWHPHIVGVHDRGKADGRLWIAMDFVDGLDAGRLLTERYPAGMPIELVVSIVTAVASALDYAHNQGLLHRDVKPANIMLTTKDDGHEQRILLADFGIARNVDDISGLTATNMTVGTVAYSAPEQLMGEDIDGRADQYALAATAYHLLTGSQLFPHSNPAVVISRHLNAEPPSLSDLRPELATVDSVLAQALAKDPTDRFSHCSDFAQTLAAKAPGTTSHSTVAPTRPAPAAAPKLTNSGSAIDRMKTAAEASVSRPPRRWLAASAAVAVVVAVAAVALVWQPWKQNRSSTAPTTSQSGAHADGGLADILGAPPIASAPTTEPSAATAATQTETTVAAVNGQPAHGFREVLNIANTELAGCDSPSAAAITPDIYSCYPSAAGADLCWPAPPASMLCLDDPWAKGLRRFAFDTAYLTTLQTPSSPQPFALLLDDDTRCRLISGGARGDRPDGYLPAYNCGTAGSTLAVLMGPNATDPIDRSASLWTVQVAPLGSPPQTRSVTTAWFAGT